MENCENQSVEEVVGTFAEENRQAGLRVFVAGGSRSGNDSVYVEEAYNLGKQIAKMEFKLDFGLSSSGIMGAVARGVLDGWNKKKCKETPIQGITTKEYYNLYQTDEILAQIEDVIVAQTLEERKLKLLNADFVVFAPGGVGTLDELAYDCVAMQDGFLQIKPFILYNIEGYFHHIVEYLKSISAKGFADPMPFIIVDNSNELSIVFRLLKLHLRKSILPQLSPVRRRNGVLSIFCRLCLFSLRVLPFLSENKNAAACQAFQPVCVCMVSCVCNCAFIIAAARLHVNTTGRSG